VALCAIVVAYQQRYESISNTGTPLTTVRIAFDKLRLHRTTQRYGKWVWISVTLSVLAMLGNCWGQAIQQMHHWLFVQMLRTCNASNSVQQEKS
jgi:heme exporter protein D